LNGTLQHGEEKPVQNIFWDFVILFLASGARFFIELKCSLPRFCPEQDESSSSIHSPHLLLLRLLWNA
jgi:hypothetical protein